uniref:Uncharacterized protein n=1 Tax=Romanomermis culicivorax TaxID=13658 RepID=A0A915K834_ROMCU
MQLQRYFFQPPEKSRENTGDENEDSHSLIVSSLATPKASNRSLASCASLDPNVFFFGKSLTNDPDLFILAPGVLVVARSHLDSFICAGAPFLLVDDSCFKPATNCGLVDKSSDDFVDSLACVLKFCICRRTHDLSTIRADLVSFSTAERSRRRFRQRMIARTSKAVAELATFIVHMGRH